MYFINSCRYGGVVECRRLARLKRLHAKALGIYMAARMLGRDGEVQKRRLERLASELSKYDINEEALLNP